MLKFLTNLRIVRKLARRSVKRRIKRMILRSRPTREVFSQIYLTNYWGDAETASGNGSRLASTEVFRAEIESFLHGEGVRTLFDAPCGDFNWMKHVKFPDGMRYIGADIVKELIESLREDYKNVDSTSFMVIDIINDPHPRSDIWLCRDGLFHFSFADIFSTLDRFVSSGTPACLLTTHTHISHNTDIRTGFFRPLNLLEAPFRLPKPATTLRDSPLREMERSVGWWRNEEIAEALRRARQAGAT